MVNKLSANKIAYGMFLSEIAHPNLIRLIKVSGCDFVVVDCEHGYFDHSQVAAMAAVASCMDYPMIVRISGISRAEIQKYLDSGVRGLLCPMLETKEQAMELVRYGKYSPVGKRGLSTMRPHSDYNPGKMSEYTVKANEKVMLYAQIETVKGVENIEDILSVEGLEGIFIGPNDLSDDLGVPGEINNEKVMETIGTILEAAKKADKPCGIVSSNRSFLKHWERCGMSIISCNSELGLLKRGITDMLSDVKNYEE